MTSDVETRLRDVIQHAATAPSAHNTQPWDVARTGECEVTISRSLARTLDTGDPTTRQATLSIGMFVEAILTAAPSHGFNAEVENRATLPSVTELARVVFSERPGGRQAANGELTTRATFRGPFGASPVMPAPLTELDVARIVISEPNVKREVAGLVAQGLLLAMSLPAMRRELANLLHWRSESFTVGMAIEDMVLDAEQVGAPSDWFLHQFDAGGESTRQREWWTNAPCHVVISSRTDDPYGWLEAGRVAMRTLLFAAKHGLVHDIAAGPVEIPFLSPQLRHLTEPTLRPQFLCRLGTVPSGVVLHREARRRSLDFP